MQPCAVDPAFWTHPLRDAGITDTSGLTDRKVDHDRDEAVRQSTERASIYPIYRDIAVPLKGAALRPVSLMMLAQKLASAQAGAAPLLVRQRAYKWLRACADGLRLGNLQRKPLDDDDTAVMLEMRGDTSSQRGQRRPSEVARE